MWAVGEQMVIRRVTDGDWQTSRDFRLRSLAEDPDAFGSTLREHQDKPDEWWRRRVRDDDTMCTYADVEDPARWRGIATVARDDEASRVAGIMTMWVAPHSRGRGVGRRLLAATVAHAATWGCTQVQLYATAENRPATALYESYGFRPTGATKPLRPGSPVETREYPLELP